jgi:N-alpha-acetyl-L-2,4-diaminobutyrate deacetylase
MMDEALVERSRISNPIDFGKNGRQAGYLRAPLSRNKSGWG